MCSFQRAGINNNNSITTQGEHTTYIFLGSSRKGFFMELIIFSTILPSHMMNSMQYDLLEICFFLFQII